METIFEIKSSEGELIATNLPTGYTYDSTVIDNKIKVDKCPITEANIRHGYFKTENGQVYLASYNVPTNKIFKRYFEACDFFVPTLVQSVNAQKEQTKQNFRRFKHNLVTHHTNMLQELESRFPIENAEKGIHNQIEFVQNILKDDPKNATLSILKVIKSVNLMKSEFDVYDMLSSEKPSLEFYSHYPHKIILLVLSPFWLELVEKGIRIDLKECDQQVSVDYKSISVVFSHLFENASKYTANNSSFTISFHDLGNMIEVNFEMISLKIKPEEKDKIFHEKFSGDYAKATTLAGNGIGMSIVNNLVEMNKGVVGVEINTNPKENITKMGIPFEKNKFTVTLPK